MITRANKLILIIVLCVIALSAFFVYRRVQGPQTKIEPAQITYTNPFDKPVVGDPSKQVQPLPESLQIKVPFTPQAPTANWDELHNEACEEASSIMANAYFSRTFSLPAPDVEKEIAQLTEWQQSKYGYHLSITTDETAEMIKANYGLNAEVVPTSAVAIKEALAANKLVLVPANGQLLDNPHFKQPGPIYHMFVITGFNSNNFITNDPGTKDGENYTYSYSTIESANGTWSHEKKAVDLNQKRIIIISKL
jgi:hypothetical protein